MVAVVLNKNVCLRCTREWYSRPKADGSLVLPLVCPKCKSPYWNKPKVVR